MAAQLFARLTGHRRNFSQTRLVMGFHEQFRDLLFGFMHGRCHDVRRRFIGQLQDVFAQIGFHHANTSADQCVVKRNFFGDHRLGFGDCFHAIALRDTEHNRVRFFSRFSPMYFGTTADCVAFKFDQIRVEVIDDAVPQRGGVGANVFPVVDLRHAQRAAIDEFAFGFLQRGLQYGVVKLGARRLLEMHALYLHDASFEKKHVDRHLAGFPRQKMPESRASASFVGWVSREAT